MITQPSPCVSPSSRARALAHAVLTSRAAQLIALGACCMVVGMLVGVGVRTGEPPVDRRLREASFHASQSELTAAGTLSIGDASLRYASSAPRRNRVLAGQPTAEVARRHAAPDFKRAGGSESKQARAAAVARAGKREQRGKLGGQSRPRSKSMR